MTKAVTERINKLHRSRFYGRPPRVEELFQRACERYGVTRECLLRGRRFRKHPVVQARQEVCVELRKWNWSYSRIGKTLGGLHHTTVMHILHMAGASDLCGPLVRVCEIKVPDESGIWAI